MMKSSNVFIFVIGAMIGSVTTWYFSKRKYDQIMQEQIDSVKEVYKKRSEETVSETQKKEIKDYLNNIYGRNGYAVENSKDEIKECNICGPYIISPNEFGTIDEYETVTLTYYSDGVLADDNDDIIDDVDSVIGEDSLTHFGEYEEDSVFVRNGEKKCDYEVIYDNRSYYDVVGSQEN